MQKEQSLGKRIALEFIDYLRFKVESDSLTMEEVDSIAKTFESSLNLTGTADDFARFYGKSKESVKVVISRKMFEKPLRKVLYSFTRFRRSVPDSWTTTRTKD